jgi:hypothetical protein
LASVRISKADIRASIKLQDRRGRRPYQEWDVRLDSLDHCSDGSVE